MKKLWVLLLAFGFLLASCGPKPQYKTRQGKKKIKYYNKQQFNHPDRDTDHIKAMKKKNKK